MQPWIIQKYAASCPAWNPELGQLEAAMAQIPILLPALSSSVERHSVCNLFFLNPLKGDPCQST